MIPPFPQRLEAKPPNLSKCIILDELENLCVNMPLLQSIKDIPIYNKFINDSCMNNPGRNKKDPPIINVVGTLYELMLGRHSNPKYSNLGILIIDVHINKTLVPKKLIDLEETINVKTKDTMLKFNLHPFLRRTTTILQLIDSSVGFPLGVLEDIIVSLDTWEYLANFIVLKTKEKLGDILSSWEVLGWP